MKKAKGSGRGRSKKRRRRGRRLPRQLKFTREGRVFVLTTLGVGAGAVNTGNNLLYLILGLMLSLIILSGLLSELTLRKVSVRRLLPSRVFAGLPCLIGIELANNKERAPSFSVEVCDHGPGADIDDRCYFLKVDPKGKEIESYGRVPHKRGELALSEIKVLTRYPFGLFEKSRIFEVGDTLLVYPKVLRSSQDAPSLTFGGQESPSNRAGGGTETAGLREYQRGDDARLIHWRKSAALGEVVIRERLQESDRILTLNLDERLPALEDPAWQERFEHSISLAAGRAQEALGAGWSVQVQAQKSQSPRLLAGDDPDPIYRYLALLSPVSYQSLVPAPRAES